MHDGTERWLPVVGYEGLYDVSDLGRVRSLPRRNCRGTVLRPTLTKLGYLRVEPCADGSGRKVMVHVLVAAAFHGPCPPGLEVRHLDGNSQNNAASNLAYGTASENCLDMVQHGTHHKARVTHCPAKHEYKPANTYITPAGTRWCKECHRIKNREYMRATYARRKKASAA